MTDIEVNKYIYGPKICDINAGYKTNMSCKLLLFKDIHLCCYEPLKLQYFIGGIKYYIFKHHVSLIILSVSFIIQSHLGYSHTPIEQSYMYHTTTL